MGSVKTGLDGRINQGREAGDEIAQTGQEKVGEAQESRQAIDGTNAVDDETQAAVQEAMNEAKTIAENIASSEIREPSDQIGNELGEVSNEATEYGDRETENAGSASGAVGDFNSVGAEI